MSGKPRKDRTTIRSRFIAVRLTETQWREVKRLQSKLKLRSAADVLRLFIPRGIMAWWPKP